MSDLFDTRSHAFTAWMASIWKANDMRNKNDPLLEKQLEECNQLKKELEVR